jgi:protein ImuA
MNKHTSKHTSKHTNKHGGNPGIKAGLAGGASLSGASLSGANLEVASLGVGLDAALPWGGLPYGGLHEVTASAFDGAGSGFAVGLFGCFVRTPKSGAPMKALWCRAANARQEHGVAHGPGLAAFGLEPDRVLFAEARKPVEALWAIEQGLRCRSLRAVLGEVDAISPIASRRLALAAAANGVACVMLRTGSVALNAAASGASASAALTRWRVKAVRDAPLHFDAELWRCRAGAPNAWRLWRLRWDQDALCFGLVALLAGGKSSA